MYEEKDHKISWKTLLKRILLYLLAIIILLGVIALITRCAKNPNKNDKKPVVKVDLSKEAIELREANLKYLSADNLPQNDGESRSVKLKYLIAKDLIKPLSDSEGNVCDTNESYSEVTKNKNNYSIVTKIKCGKNEKTLKEYIGCFEKCDGKICIGTETDKGICSAKEDTTTTKPKTTSTTKTTNKTTTAQKNCYDHIRYYCISGYEITSDNRCKKKVMTTNTTKIKVAEEYFYTKEKKYPKEYYNAPKSGYTYEWAFEEYQKDISLYIWRRITYSLCPSGYKYNSTNKSCEKQIGSENYITAQKAHKYSYNKNESGYTYNGVVSSNKCK